MTPLTDEANILYDFFPENSDDLTNIWLQNNEIY